jgi:hypothetical protein
MLRLDSFNNFNFPHMAAGTQMWGGKAVVISPNVPKFHAADELVPVMPSRLFCFLFWLFDGRPPRPLRFRAGKKIEHEQVFEMQGKLFMSPAAWDALVKESRR